MTKKSKNLKKSGEKYTGGSFSEIPPSRHQFGDLAKLAANFIEINFSGVREVQALRMLESEGIDGMYNKTELSKSDDEDLLFSKAETIELTNGKIESNSKIALTLLKGIDLYETKREEQIDGKSAQFPTVIASGLCSFSFTFFELLQPN